MEMEEKPITYMYVDCTNLTVTEFNMVSLVRGVVAIVCFALCSLALIVLLIAKIYSVKKRRRMAYNRLQSQGDHGHSQRMPLWRNNVHQRLFLYLMISTLLYLATLSMHVRHYFDSDDNKYDYCVALGYLNQSFGSVQLFFIFGIAVFVSVWLCTILGNKKCTWGPLMNKMDRIKLEGSFVVLSIVISFGVAFIPFAFTSYDTTGPWCWIKSLNRDCSVSVGGLTEQVLLWYAPLGLVALSSTICITVVIGVLLLIYCKVSRLPDRERLRNARQRAIYHLKGTTAEVTLLMVSLTVYVLLWIIELAGRIGATKDDTYGLWMIYAVTTPVSAAVTPVAFFVYYIGCCSGRTVEDAATATTDTIHYANEPSTEFFTASEPESHHGSSDSKSWVDVGDPGA